MFPSWSIEVPAGFSETYIAEDDYWHAWDEHRSISMSSIVLTERGAPVSAARIVRRLSPLDGSPIDALPPGVEGRATVCDSPDGVEARASRYLSGMLATDGRVLAVTITSDDLEWAKRMWLSIRAHPAPLQPLRGRGHGNAGRHRNAAQPPTH